MLAIMNIGKYSSSGIVPSGSDLFTISANQSLGQAIDFYARKGNTILGLPYMQNTIYRSVDGGATWDTISSPYYLAHIFYSSIEDKFYALELGDENIPQTLHYGESSDGETWTWETLLTNSTAKTHYYGTFIEESNGTIAFDVLKIDATNVSSLASSALATHIRRYTDETETVIGSSMSITASSGTTSISDVYPIFTSNSGKTKTTLIIESWKWVGNTYNVSFQITVGSWGIEREAVYMGTAGYSNGIKCFDSFYNSSKQSSGSSSSTRYFTRSFYSPTARESTWVNYESPRNSDSNLVFEKMYGFFQLGNYYYMAYKHIASTKWYRAGDVQTLIDVATTDVFNKADLIGEPVSEYSIDSKHFLLSMADGKVYLCEAT